MSHDHTPQLLAKKSRMTQCKTKHSSSGQGKCTFDIEKCWHVTDFWQSNRRERTSLTSSGSYWDSSTSNISNLNQKTQKTTVKPQMLTGAP